MIILTADTLNNVYVTVSELMINVSNNILFEFINELDYSKYYCLTTGNTSTSGRYDLFEINFTQNANNLNSEIYLPKSNNYVYNCYEMSSQSLDVTQAIKKVETGRCFVINENAQNIYALNNNLYS